MTGQERNELMRFLRELSTSREPVDPAVRELVAQAITQNPNVGYRLVQQVMGLRLALQAQAASAQAATPGRPAQAPAEVAGSWGASVLKVAVAAGLGAAAGTVLADQAASWLAPSQADADPGDWA